VYEEFFEIIPRYLSSLLGILFFLKSKQLRQRLYRPQQITLHKKQYQLIIPIQIQSYHLLQQIRKTSFLITESCCLLIIMQFSIGLKLKVNYATDTILLVLLTVRNFVRTKHPSDRNLARFTSIAVSPDKMEIGFTIESDTLAPDTVVGIFSKSTNIVKLLTSYYLGNEFISFSPNGTYFIYRGECWEAMCGLFVKDSKTLSEKASINNPEYVDSRQWDARFVQWIRENEVEYKLESINSNDVKIERKSF